ncbi:MAG: MaoC family dehydratase [Pseudomonadota bacterium]
MAGYWFEEFSEGQVFEHAVSRTITETDNVWFSCLTMNTQPLHIDFHKARTQTDFGQPIVNSMLTQAIMIGITVSDTTLGTTAGNLGMDNVKFPRPMFHGDSISARTTVLSVRESKSHPDKGIVSFRHEGFNQHGELVATCDRAAFMFRKPAENT